MKQRTPRISVLGSLAALALAVGLTSCKSGDGDTIKIGEFASLTGKEATFGTSSHEGTLLAIEEINAAGGVLGKPLELLTEDNQSKPSETSRAVNKLISRDGVVALLGEVASSRSLEAAPIAQRAGIPMISPASTNPAVTETGDFIFRACFTDPFQGAALANFATNELKATRVAVLTDVKSDYSKGLAKHFKEKFLANGGELVTELDFSGGDKDFRSQLTTIKNANPDAVFLPGYYTDVALIAIQARQVGLEAPLFGGDGWESDVLLEIGKEAVNGYYFSTHCAPDQGNEKMEAFVAAYRKRWNNKSPDAMAALGYDSALLLADALKRAGSTEPKALRDALAATTGLPGASGTISLNENRDAVKALVFIKIENGRFTYSATVNP
jgi:branched-chain amino acid transport system substrate-binding protein